MFASVRDITASLSQSHEVYPCSWGWLGVLLLATTVNLAASLFALWCEFRTNIQDALAYYSPLTQGAAYFDLDGGGTLDAMFHAKLLRDYRVGLGVLTILWVRVLATLRWRLLAKLEGLSSRKYVPRLSTSECYRESCCKFISTMARL